MFETANLLEAERQIQEEVENARIRAELGQELQARRRLFTRREPNAAMLLTAAFIDNEIQFSEVVENARLNWLRRRQRENDRELMMMNRPGPGEYRFAADYNANGNGEGECSWALETLYLFTHSFCTGETFCD